MHLLILAKNASLLCYIIVAIVLLMKWNVDNNFEKLKNLKTTWVGPVSFTIQISTSITFTFCSYINKIPTEDFLVLKNKIYHGYKFYFHKMLNARLTPSTNFIAKIFTWETRAWNWTIFKDIKFSLHRLSVSQGNFAYEKENAS